MAERHTPVQEAISRSREITAVIPPRTGSVLAINLRNDSTVGIEVCSLSDLISEKTQRRIAAVCGLEKVERYQDVLDSADESAIAELQTCLRHHFNPDLPSSAPVNIVDFSGKQLMNSQEAAGGRTIVSSRKILSMPYRKPSPN